ncbi:MAG: antitoxin VapB family protein [Candidatus Micrarchaeota archaeon]|nr:antitoxin VapB family protein [Candidatus Micrarchaeota archaeon]
MSKIISISDETYNTLVKFKGKTKSFTQVINELIGRRSGNIEKYFGVLKDRDLSELKKETVERRKMNVGRNIKVR